MRKLKLQMNGKDLTWDNEVVKFCLENLKNVDCIALGGKTAGDFIPYWADVANNPTKPEYKLEKPLGKPLNNIRKVVFSRKLKTSKWKNATVLNGNIVEKINTLKRKKGKDIIVYGGYTFASSLIQHKLVDEFYFLINPTTIVSGDPLFKSLKINSKLTLVKFKLFKCGTVLLNYKKNN